MIFDITWEADQKLTELIMLQEFLVKHNFFPKKIFEIGTRYGGTALLWAKIAQTNNGIVYCLDLQFLRQEPYHSTYVGTEWEKYVVEIEGDSHSDVVKKRVKEQVGNNVDFLFIDGDHSYKGVKEDFVSYSSLVKENGLIVFHDIVDSQLHRNAGCYVSSLWNEIKEMKKYEIYEFMDTNNKNWAGIGVIVWRN